MCLSIERPHFWLYPLILAKGLGILVMAGRDFHFPMMVYVVHSPTEARVEITTRRTLAIRTCKLVSPTSYHELTKKVYLPHGVFSAHQSDLSDTHFIS